MSTTTIEAPALTAAQAVALTLLREGYSERSITARTDTTPGDLYRLAALHGISAPCGTVEGHRCHEARDEDSCTPCQTAHGRSLARARARERRTVPISVLSARLAARRGPAR